MHPQPAVLVAEDETQSRESLCAQLEDEGYRVHRAANGLEACRILSEGPLDAALLDIGLPGKDGLAILRELRQRKSPPAVLMMTDFSNSAAAIGAMALGAFDSLTKPIRFEELRTQLERAIENRHRPEELDVDRAQEHQTQDRSGLPPEIIGNSPAMQKLYKLVGQVAPTDSTALICGESGTGKELVVSALHFHSPRAARPLVKVNCAAIPETLLEAEMFGYERGAFTGAAQRRIGKIEFAGGGTIFLDEVGELTPSTQAKLLRVLEDRSLERLGSNRTLRFDVRVLAATNQDLERAVKEGSFREDLYYRLKVVTIRVPALRERREDIPELAQFLLRRCSTRLKRVPRLSAEAARLLQSRDWRGNVRELEHCLERASILSHSGVILPEHVDPSGATSAADPFASVPLEEGLHAAVRKLERAMIQRALAQGGGNRSRAAELLRISRRVLYDKLDEFGLK